MVSVTIDNEQVRLEMRVYEPTAAGPVPTLVFNHGSTGRGTDPRVFTRPLDFPEVARFFVVKGVINFVGGWNGARCEHAATINQSIFVRGARYPGETIWLYGDDDPFCPCHTAARALPYSWRPAAAARFTSCRRSSAATTSGDGRIGGDRSSRTI
jgi:hypothetical protein